MVIRANDWDLPPHRPEDVVEACSHAERSAGISSFRMAGGSHEGYADAHDDLEHDAAGRYYVRINRADDAVLAWEISEWQYVVAADVQIYAYKEVAPISFITVSEAAGTHATKGALEGTRPSGALGEDFAGGRFTTRRGPYLARLRITKVQPNTKVTVSVRRLYFEVLPVAIVGAGIAGIRAAATLLECDPSGPVVLLEACDRLGGRAWTREWENLKVDIGCQFLQDASENPLCGVADSLGQKTFWHHQEEEIGIPVQDEEEFPSEPELPASAIQRHTPLDAATGEDSGPILSDKDERWRAARQLAARKLKTSADHDQWTQLRAGLYKKFLEEAQEHQKEIVDARRKQLITERTEALKSDPGTREQAKVKAREDVQKAASPDALPRVAQTLPQKTELLEKMEADDWEDAKVAAAVKNAAKAAAELFYRDKPPAELGVDLRAPEEVAEDYTKRTLENRLVRLHMALDSELDEGIEPDRHTLAEAEKKPEQPLDESGEEDDGSRGATNRMAVNGYGTIITAYADKLQADHKSCLEVFGSTAVTAVEVLPKYLRITTDKGRIYASMAIVTVSTAAIVSIQFTPALPAPISEALAFVPMGHYKKVFLPFRKDSPVAAKFFEMVKEHNEEDHEYDPYILTITGALVSWKFLFRRPLNVVVAFVGGGAAQRLDQASDEEVARETLAALGAALQLDEDAVKRGWTNRLLTSKWSADKWFRGAYTYTRPQGGVAARKLLRDTIIHERILLAGEAMRVAKDEYATAHGAWLSGEEAARKVAAQLKV